MLSRLPDDYDEHVRALRRRMRLTQDALARRIGAAGKAVIYQWESRKRRPSPVLWQRILGLAGRTPGRVATVQTASGTMNTAGLNRRRIAARINEASAD